MILGQQPVKEPYQTHVQISTWNRVIDHLRWDANKHILLMVTAFLDRRQDLAKRPDFEW